MYNKIIITVYTFLLLILISGTALAQGPGFDDDVVDEVPIDGGISALVIAGAAYGVKKLKDMKKK